MATRRWKLTPDGTKVDVVSEAGAATNSDAVELTVDLAALIYEEGVARTITREEVINSVNEILAYLTEQNWPPA